MHRNTYNNVYEFIDELVLTSLQENMDITNKHNRHSVGYYLLGALTGLIGARYITCDKDTRHIVDKIHTFIKYKGDYHRH